MAYTKTNWVSGETALSADNMNHIENGIEALDNKIGVISVANKDTDTSVPTAGYATICTLELSAGTYILTGHIRWGTIPAGRVSVSVWTSPSPGGAIDGVQISYAPSASPNLTIAQQTSVIMNLSNSATIYLTAFADSGGTVTNGILKAISLK